MKLVVAIGEEWSRDLPFAGGFDGMVVVTV
jgi:hypothetical protein